MDPANFKLLQVTFNEEDLPPDQELDSFSTVVDYDSQFQFTGQTPACQNVNVSTAFQTSSFQSRGVPQPSRVKVTQIHQQKVWSGIPSTSPSQQCSFPTSPTSSTQQQQHFLVNPDSDLDQSATTYRKGPATLSDIKTLYQVYTNTTSARKHLRRQLTMSDSGKPASPGLGDGTFETVAEALHLQWSVIGNKDLTPAPPDVVAQVVAEAERRLKGNVATDHSHLQGSHAVEDKKISDDNVVASLHLHESTSDLRDGTILESNLANTAREPDLPRNTNSNASVSKDLVQILPESVSRTKETQQWFRSREKKHAPDTPNHPNHHGPNRLLEMQPSSPNHNRMVSMQISPESLDQSPNIGVISSAPEMEKVVDDASEETFSTLETVTDDTQSMSSGTSDLESFRDGNAHSADHFLKSLPPIQSVDMKKFESAVKAGKILSPADRETSLKPLSVDSQLSNLASQSILNTLQSIGNVNTEEYKINNEEKPTISQSFPKTNFVIPKVGPLFQRQIQLPKKTTMPEARNVVSNSEVEALMRDKANLEGQLEMLSDEAQETLQERAKLQAQVAALQLRLMSHSDEEREAQISNLKMDLYKQQTIREDLQGSLSDTQKVVEEKMGEAKVLQEELKTAQDASDKFQMRLKEIRDEMRAKEMTIQALKNKIAELYVDVQNSLQEKMASDNEARLAKTDLSSAIGAKDWYQQQLQAANNARIQLQQEMTNLQAQISSHSMILEKIKTENAKLRQQLKDVQQRALKEKELLARQLETIEADMMDREAAFQEIQREQTFLEDTFTTRLQSAKEEKSQIPIMLEVTAELESQLDNAQKSLKKKQAQIFSLENEQMDLMKKLTLSHASVLDKERILDEIEERSIEMEMQIKAYQMSIGTKDNEILKLQEEKAVSEIALNAALEEKCSVNKSLDTLKVDLGKVEKSFKHLRQELLNRDKEVDQIQRERQKVVNELEDIKDKFIKESKELQSSSKAGENKAAVISELQASKNQLEKEISALTDKVATIETANKLVLKENKDLEVELSAVKQTLVALENELQEVRVVEKLAQQAEEKVMEHSVDQQQLESENKKLKEKMNHIEKDNQKLLTKQKAKVAKLNKDMKMLQDELVSRQVSYDSNIELLSARLHDALAENEKIKLELEMAEKKFDVSVLQQQDQVCSELQTLVTEIQSLRIGKQTVEMQLQELQQLREQEIGQFQEQLSALEKDLQFALENQKVAQATEQTNKSLDLELEKERGRLAGIMQSNTTLKQHVASLEDALAGRESTVVEFQTKLQTVIQESDQKEHEYIRRIQTLEGTMQKEKNSQRDLRKQIGTKISENKKLKRHSEGLKSEQQQLQLDVDQHIQAVHILQAELDTNKQLQQSTHSELKSLEMENCTLTREMERLKMELDDNHTRDPVVQEQIHSLQWHLSQKQQEVETVQGQMKMVEQRQQLELVNIHEALQEKQNELDQVKEELAESKQERLNHQTKVSELRTALKASVHHHKLVKKIGKKKSKSSNEETSKDISTQVEPDDIPPLPFDLEVMDKLLEETAVKALESKPLDNLQSCLGMLRSEISGLQHQIEAHTITVATSAESWNAVEAGVNELKEVVKTVSDTAVRSACTTSIAAAAVETADRLSGPGTF